MIPRGCCTVLFTSLIRKESDIGAAGATKEAIDEGIIRKGFTRKEITAAYNKARTTMNRWQAKERELELFEQEHSIEDRWTCKSLEYQNVQKLLAERIYRRAVDNLERLVIQHLFELTKLGMNGVGSLSNFWLLFSLDSPHI